jgi:hypothetical protein
MTMAISGTGSAAWEGRQPDRAGRRDGGCQRRVQARMVDVAERAGPATRSSGLGAKCLRLTISAAWRETKSGRHRRAETSPCLATDRGDLAPCKVPGHFACVDTVTALGGVPVEVDACDRRLFRQKCLSCLPGLSPVPFGLVPLTYRAGQLLGAGTASTSHRPDQHDACPTRHASGARRGVRKPLGETSRTTAAGGWRRSAFVIPRRRLYPAAAQRGNVPEGVDDAAVRSALRNRFGIEISGLGPGMWRIGPMGYGSRRPTLFFLRLEQPGEQSFWFTGASVAAANRSILT